MISTSGNMDTINTALISIDPIYSAEYPENIQVCMLRLDKIHRWVSGNKWFKLFLNLEEAQRWGWDTVLSFGGAHSNHLLALASIAMRKGIKAIGVVRGLHGQVKPTQTLQLCTAWGMQLIYADRTQYGDRDYHAELQTRYPNAFLIPEGGANEYGRKGSESIAQWIPAHFSHVCCAVGTGTMFTGLRRALPITTQLLGFAPMKGGKYLAEHIRPYLTPEKDTQWKIWDDWHMGGFGKINALLLQFIQQFEAINHITLDPVYTSKMMIGVNSLIQQGYFPPHARILCIHSGGLR